MPLNFDGLDSGDDDDDTERTLSGRLAMSYLQDGCTFGTGRLWAHSSSSVFKPSEDQARHMALRKTTCTHIILIIEILYYYSINLVLSYIVVFRF